MEPETETETTEQPTEQGTEETTSDPEMNEPIVVVPVEIREITRTENDMGKINIIHEITLGDLIVSTFLFAILIFMFLERVIRRG
ncbi:hypothetical protein [Bacillus sp. B15-48]|uniref:hypothetical protein n=1 Tax=Bacillus sp. B15-48 TaxID=1548601 RepID=UPI00193F6E16|nr:hypothetical protein [Bacillus sp. B15-48]MBM4765451.1 hypothetical protein [Bacillus sp. B15-48]